MSSHQGTVAEQPEHLVPIAECPTTAVTVFVNRAEVTRSVIFSPPAASQGADAEAPPSHYIVVVQGMTSAADTDSIRVKLAAENEADVKKVVNLIREVSYAVHHRKREDTADQPRARAAREAKAVAAAEQKQARAQLKRVQERDDLVQGYMRSMLVTPTATPVAGATVGAAVTAGPAAGAGLDVVEKLLTFHQTHSAGVDTEAAALQLQLTAAVAKEQAADAELREVAAAASGNVASRDVTIVLDGPTAAAVAAASGGTVSLALTYVVTNASWSPVYDMRVDDLHSEPVPTAIEVTYSAVIQQATGEDWNAVAVRLSTAATHSGKGAPPLPPTRQARWVQPMRFFHQQQLRGASNMNMAMPMQSAMADSRGLERRMASRAPRRERQLSVDAHDDDLGGSGGIGAGTLSGDDGSDDDDAVSPTTGGGGEGSEETPNKAPQSSTVFTVERAMTIKADNKEHKCTIAVVPRPATFRLFATPELEELAYIQARGVNNAALTFLASERVSVFLAGSFITKTPLRMTSPGEAFTVFLGVEAAVKVEHKTIQNVKTAGGVKTGLLQGKTKSTRLVEYRTLLHNSLARPVEITVVHLMPRAASDQIVVTLLKPPRNEVPVSGTPAAAAAAVAGGGAKSDENAAGEAALGANSVMQNKITNNVVFTRTLAPQSKQELAFSYEVVWPHDAETGDVEVA
jgi:hypothetical protein